MTAISRCCLCGGYGDDYDHYRMIGNFYYCSKCRAVVFICKPTRMGTFKK